MANMALSELPADILNEILQHIWKPPPQYSTYETWATRTAAEGECLRALCSARLTCRALWRVATPLLFRVLHVSIDPKSVEAFDLLSKNPLVAAHAQGVVVNLAAYSSELAVNRLAFRKSRMREINELFNYWHYDFEFREPVDDQGNPDPEYEEYERLDCEISCLWSAWRETQPSDDGENDDEEGADEEEDEDAEGQRLKLAKYKDTLVNGFNEYARRRREHIECLESPDTVKTLAAAISRLGCGGKLHFTTEQPPGLSRYNSIALNLLIDNPDTLLRAITQPHPWTIFDMEKDGETLEEIRVLSALPLALHAAGVEITDLFVSCFPHYRGFPLLLSGHEQQETDVELLLRQAFAKLELFEFGWTGMNSKGIRQELLPETEASPMHAYIRAVLSSSHLQRVGMSFRTYGVASGRGLSHEAAFSLGPTLLPFCSLTLSRFCLSNVQLKQDELGPVLKQLGQSLRFFFIYAIQLLDGAWAPLLEVIRDSTAWRCREGRCRALLSGLTGGELGVPREPKRDKWFGICIPVRSVPREVLLEECEKFISGERDTNPLRELSGDEDLDPASDDGSAESAADRDDVALI
ncbi:hypothetical protein NQ176_g916 [Zarea fungicola]|uniref:Uncharacterized protein n=1 Tax=Zarea fungicola TaxID=93591 RepID=A0ACC1NVQ8_9HYPO|nr:hypothetical protein NQ176_g916 [Lecanicillium fungicola]